MMVELNIANETVWLQKRKTTIWPFTEVDAASDYLSGEPVARGGAALWRRHGAPISIPQHFLLLYVSLL